MDLGMIRLGRMGANRVRRLMRHGHRCVMHDISAETVKAFGKEGAEDAVTLEEFVRMLPAPVLTSAVYQRISSRGEADFADKVLSAMRFAFGGHLEGK